MRDCRLLTGAEPGGVIPVEIVVPGADLGAQPLIGVGFDLAALREVAPGYELHPIRPAADCARPAVAKGRAVAGFPEREVFRTVLLRIDRHHIDLAELAVHGPRIGLHGARAARGRGAPGTESLADGREGGGVALPVQEGGHERDVDTLSLQTIDQRRPPTCGVRLASKAETTNRPSASLYAAGLLATEAMICVTAAAFDPKAVISGMTTILKRGSTACAA